MAKTAAQFSEERKLLPPANRVTEDERDRLVQDALDHVRTQGKKAADSLRTRLGEQAKELDARLEENVVAYEQAKHRLQTTPAHLLDLAAQRKEMQRLASEYDRLRLSKEALDRTESQADAVLQDPERYYENLMRRFPMADDRVWAW